MSDPAFPGIAGEDGCGAYTYQEFADGQRVPIQHNQGMTLLDYFAGQALAGCLANGVEYEYPAEAASDAYNYAAAMLKEKAKHD